MLLIISLIFLFLSFNSSQTIKHLSEISIEEELPIGTMVTSLTDKIPNLDQSIEYDLVTPLSNDLDLFSINHLQHSLIIKTRIDYENLCLKNHHCIISVSIAVSKEDTIDVYILPIRIINISDNPIKFLVNRTVIEIEENDENWWKKSYSLPTAYDDDGDEITYSIYLQNWNKPDGLFEFNETNLLLKPLKQFDREEQNIYLLRLIAHNQNDISTDIIILIKDLNDNPPRCEQNQTLFLISNISFISLFSLNVTDLDEGDNGKLEYHFINPIAGFSIDRYNGQIKFDYKQWRRSNESILMVNITDHGKPFRLSTKCLIEIQLTFLFEIHFQSNNSIINQTEVSMDITNLNLPIGRFRIFDKQANQLCVDCLMKINSSLQEIFYLDDTTFDLYLNYNSIILMRILTNYGNNKENLSIYLPIEIINSRNPSIISTKNYSFILHLNKLNLLVYSNIYFLKIYENMFINERISIYNRYHHCLNNQSKDLVLIDSTDTFEMDQNFNLILKKYLNIKQQKIYHLNLQQKQNNSTNEINFCSIHLQLYVFNPYSTDNIYPYFPQSFYILTSQNISDFSLPSLPSHVKYISSVPDLISINPSNASIILRSSLLYSSYYYDFQIQAIDSHLPSLTSSIPIRIFFGINKHSPRLSINSTRQSLEIFPSKFLFQIKAYDPDILLNDQTNLFPPTIEYQIDTSINNIEIERFTGRIFLKDFNTTKINFTLIMTDFGQPNRLTTRQRLIFDIKSKENLSLSFFVISLLLLLIIILLSILFLLINCCCCCPTHQKSLKSREKSTWTNISPTTPDTRLIDNEYITTTSLPRASSREQGIYPTYSNNSFQHPRKNLSHLSLDKITSTEKISIKEVYQQHVSMTDIDKYLERFEKIYNDSSSQQYLHQPLGSVV